MRREHLFGTALVLQWLVDAAFMRSEWESLARGGERFLRRHSGQPTAEGLLTEARALLFAYGRLCPTAGGPPPPHDDEGGSRNHDRHRKKKKKKEEEEKEEEEEGWPCLMLTGRTTTTTTTTD